MILSIEELSIFSRERTIVDSVSRRSGRRIHGARRAERQWQKSSFTVNWSTASVQPARSGANHV